MFRCLSYKWMNQKSYMQKCNSKLNTRAVMLSHGICSRSYFLGSTRLARTRKELKSSTSRDNQKSIRQNQVYLLWHCISVAIWWLLSNFHTGEGMDSVFLPVHIIWEYIIRHKTIFLVSQDFCFMLDHNIFTLDPTVNIMK